METVQCCHGNTSSNKEDMILYFIVLLSKYSMFGHFMKHSCPAPSRVPTHFYSSFGGGLVVSGKCSKYIIWVTLYSN